MADTMADRVKESRESKGLNIGTLALRLGVTDRTVRLIESGTTRKINHLLFLKLARVLNVDPYYLAHGDAKFGWEDEGRLPADAQSAIAHLSARIDALDQRVNNLESQARDEPRHKPQG